MPTVEVNGIETYYEHRGAGPPVVFAHGATLDCRGWEPQVESLADDYEVVTYDLRGHGRTEGSDHSAYTMDLLAADLKALIDELGLERPVVVGHSLGGMFALEFAAQYPDSLEGLVLVDSQVAPGLTTMQTVIQRVLMPLQMKIQRVVGVERAQAAMKLISRPFVDDDGDEEMDEELEAYVEETDEMLDAADRRKTFTGVSRFERPEFDAIDVPTLGVYGAESPDMMHRNAVELHREVDDVELRLVPEAGHGLAWEQSDAFNRTLREFLEDRAFPDGP